MEDKKPENIENVGQKLTEMKEQISERGDVLDKLGKQLYKMFEPKFGKKGTINGKPVNITLTKQAGIILNFMTEEEAEKFYNELK